MTPSVLERRVYDLATDFHGFEGVEEDPERFDPTFLAAFTHAVLPAPPVPVFFFIPKVRSAWAVARTKELCRAAIKNQPNSKEAVRSALSRMNFMAPPWALEGEPTGWLSFGFTRQADKILPAWCKDKLV